MLCTVIAVVNASFMCQSILASTQNNLRSARGVMKYSVSVKAEADFFNFWPDEVKIFFVSPSLNTLCLPLSIV